MKKIDMQYINNIDVTVMIGILNIVTYIILNLLYGFNLFSMPDGALLDWGEYTVAVLRDGKYYQLITALFVHANLAHLGSNLLFLLIYGLRFEELESKTNFAIVYFVSGLMGNIATLIFPNVLSVGASGAIFGIFGALLVVLREKNIKHANALIFLAIIYFTLTISFTTNFVAHGIGLLAGTLTQIIVYYLKK